ncbi:MAG: UvrD-helicase domain-containing protein [Firmicutes bacterium]|nr:UvrD-helicase domain-containing protein [Bacillota bacterium]
MSGQDHSGAALVDARERRLAESDLSRSYWVEAGAGTGKTTLLIRRLLTIIFSEAARLSEIAAITFTEKAAAELKARLRDELEGRAAGAPPDELAPIRQALEELETAAITTIHSFAGSLLRERPVEAAVDPHFRIADEGDLDDLLEQVWEEWFFSEVSAAPEVLSRALTLGVSPERLRELGGILYRQRDLVMEGRPPEPLVPVPFFDDLLEARLPELKSLLDFCAVPEDRGYRHLLEIIGAAERYSSLDGLEKERFLLRIFPAVASRGNQNNWQPRERCLRQKEICSELKAAQKAALRSVRERLTNDLVRWCRGYLEAVERAKEEAGLLDFQDLLLKARNLLRDSKEVRRYFQRRFRYLLVDEFQDTDPLQVDLLFLLAEEEPRAGSWQEAVPARGKLFLVGDPKQSIYRFRRADIEIYQEARQQLLEHGEALSISQNFRTLPALIEWVNDTFSRLIEPQGRYQPDYQHLSAYRPPRNEPSVVLLEPCSSLDALRADEIRAAEAAAVAGLIKTAVGEWSIPAAQGGSRPLQYGDIALLFPTTTGLYHFEEALRRCGIPFRLEGGRQFFFREEISFLKSLLVAVGDPFAEVALVAVLRYWAGISDELLFHYTASGGRLSYLDDPGAKYPLLQEAFALLREAHRRRQQLSVAALAGELLEKTWFWQRASLRRYGQQAAGNLRKALQMIRLLEMERPLTLKGAVNWLNRMAEQGREEAESLLHDPGSDAVQLLTIHKAKGLEFPAVFLVNMGGRVRGGTPFMADRVKGHFYLKLGELVSPGLEEAEAQEKLRLEAERIRLFYVATTRARDILVLPRFYKEGSPGFWAYLEKAEAEADDLWAGALPVTATEPFAGGADEAAAGAAPEEDGTALAEKLVGERRLWFDELAGTIRSAAVPGPYSSAGGLAGHAAEEAAGSAAAALYGDGAAVVQTGGIAFGSAFHDIMERIELRDPSPGQLAGLADRAAKHWGSGAPAELVRLVQSTLEHPLLVRAGQAALLLRELPFIYEFDDLLVEGIIDLLFREEEGLVIVDYKTDVGEPERRWEGYQRQGAVYGLAMAAITGLPVKEISFLFVREGLVKSLLHPEPAALRELLRQT